MTISEYYNRYQAEPVERAANPSDVFAARELRSGAVVWVVYQDGEFEIKGGSDEKIHV